MEDIEQLKQQIKKLEVENEELRKTCKTLVQIVGVDKLLFAVGEVFTNVGEALKGGNI